MQNITYINNILKGEVQLFDRIKEILCAFMLICIFSNPCLAAEGDALDVFEEFAQTQSELFCESFEISAKKNTPVTDKLRFTAQTSAAIEITSAPKKGEVTITGDDGSFIYTPFENEIGADTFSYRVMTANQNSNIAVCSIDIKDVRENKPSPSSFIYSDMTGHWGEYAAIKLVERDIIKGERIGSKYYFYPDKKMSRIDALNIIISALGADSISVDGENTHIFEDSAALPDYINNSAYRAHRLGIIDGEQNGGKLYLNPYDNITRAELMKMIDRAMSSKTKSDVRTEFSDFRTVPDWAVQAVKNLVGYGIADGYEDNTIRPYSAVTKAQTVQMVYQMIKYNEQSSTPATASIIKSGFYDSQIL